MVLPTIDEALSHIRTMAEQEALQVSRKARQQMDNLGYLDADVCDLLYALEWVNCEMLEQSHWDRTIPVGTFRASHQLEGREDPDDLFVEVALKPDCLYLLACKLYGSPQ